MEFRQSMLDVLKHGLSSSGRTTFLHRILYVGEHKLGRDGLDELMKKVVSTQADLPKEEGLSGFLLVYQHCFIHLVEGSESTLRKHLKNVVQRDVESTEEQDVGSVKVVLEIAHINKFLELAGGLAPTLASPLKSGGGAAGTARVVDAVLAKTLRLLEALKKLPSGAPLSQQMMLQLPEAELVKSLLASDLIQDVRVVLEEQRVPPRITLYDDTVWPVQSDFVPYNLLEEPIKVLREKPQEDEIQENDDEGRGMKGQWL